MDELVDIGCNLADTVFDSDREAVLERARDASVAQIVLTGTTVAESRRAADLAAAHPAMLWSTAGVHPHYVAGWSAGTLADLEELSALPQVVAVGECGLDFFRDLSPRPVQDRWFQAQLELASKVRLPVFVHDRQAYASCHAILAAHRPQLLRAVVHCFTGNRQELKGYLDLDLYIGVTGWVCDERRGGELRDIVRYVPSDRLRVETDAPYLMPRTMRPRPKTRRNEPCNLPWVVEAVAACRSEGVAEVARQTTATARAFFGLPTRSGAAG